MGHKIFISYKYADDQVANLPGQWNSIARDYVNKLAELLSAAGHICKAEPDGTDLSKLKDDTIEDKLRDRIFDSTMTIVLISPRMKESGVAEKDQWIPWEVSFSLRTTRRKRETGDIYTSGPNAMLAVVLPDANDSYSYFLESKNCCPGGCITHHTNKTFNVIAQNMFNLKSADKQVCATGLVNWHGEFSYIRSIKWCDFIENTASYIETAYKRQRDIDSYDIHIDLT